MSDAPAVTPKEITLGGKQYTIQRFRGLKAVLAMAAVTRIARKVPDILNDAIKQFQGRNTVEITEAMSHLPRWSGFSTEDFDAAEARTGRRVIEIPQVMTQNEQILQALPDLFEQARKEVTRLMAILLIPNAELREADENDAVETKLDEYTNTLMYDAELDELFDLMLAAWEVLADQIGDRGDRLGKMLTKILSAFAGWRQQTTEVGEPSTLPEETTSIQEMSSEEQPISLTDSPSSTAGTEPQPSTESLG